MVSARVLAPLGLVAVLVGAPFGCAVPSSFSCSSDAECAPGGRCIGSSCAFASDECASGLRYGEHSPAELAGECVDAEISDESADEDSESGPGTETGETGETGEPDSELLLHYTFDAFDIALPMVLDVSGNGQHGQLRDFVGLGPGISNDALLLVKQNPGATAVDFPPEVLYGLPEFTFELYLRLDLIDATNDLILYFGGESSLDPPTLTLYIEQVEGPTQTLHIAYVNAQNSFGASGQTALALEQWVHLALVQADGKLIVYLDHAYELEIPATIDAGPEFSRARIGKLVGGGETLDGAIDELRIHARALAVDELLPLP